MKSRELLLKSLAAVGAKRQATFYADLFSQSAPGTFAFIDLDPACLQVPFISNLIGDLQILHSLGLIPVLHAKGRSTLLFDSLESGGIPAKYVSPKLSEITATAMNGTFPIIRERRGADVGDIHQILMNLRPVKIIFLVREGGLERRGRRIPLVNLDEHALGISGTKMSAKQDAVVQTIRGAAAILPRTSTFVMASPLNLLSELFSTTGAGTLFRRAAKLHDLKIETEDDWISLRQSIESGFGKQLKPEYQETERLLVLIAENGQGGAIIRRVNHMPYLSKFWVSQEAQGLGIGRDIWQAVTARYPTLFWRSRRDNTLNDWYMQVCDGMQVSGDWRVFWTGVWAEQLADAIQAAATQQVDFLS